MKINYKFLMLSLIFGVGTLNAFDTTSIYTNTVQQVVKNNVQKLSENIKVLVSYAKEYIKETGNLNFNINDLIQKYNLNVNSNIQDIKLEDNNFVIFLKHDFRYENYLNYPLVNKKIFIPLTGYIKNFVNYINLLKTQGITNKENAGIWYKIGNDYNIILMKGNNKIGIIVPEGTSNFVINNKEELNELPKIEGLEVKVKNYDKVENYIYHNGEWEQSNLYNDKFVGTAKLIELATSLWTKPADSTASVKNIDQGWNGFKIFKKVLITDSDLCLWKSNDNKFYVMDNYTDTINHMQIFPLGSIVYFYYDGKILKAIKKSFNGNTHMYLFFYTLREAASNLLDIPTNYNYVYVKETNKWYKIVHRNGNYNLITLNKDMQFSTYDNHGNTYTYSYYNIIVYDRKHLIPSLITNPYQYIILSYKYDCDSLTCNIDDASKARKYYNLYAFYKIPIPKVLKSNYDSNQISDSIVVDANLWTDEFDDRAGVLYGHFEPGFDYCQSNDCANKNFVPAQDAYMKYIACSNEGDNGNVKITLQANGNIDDWISVFQFFSTDSKVSSNPSCPGASTSTAATGICGSGDKKWRKYYLNTQHREDYNNIFPPFRGIKLKTIGNYGTYHFNNTWNIITPEYSSVFLIAEGTEFGGNNRNFMTLRCGTTHWEGTEMKYKNSKGIYKTFFPSYTRHDNLYGRTLDETQCGGDYIGVRYDDSTQLFGFILPSPSNYEFKFYSDFDCKDNNYIGSIDVSRKTLEKSYDNNAILVNISKIFGGTGPDGTKYTNYPKTGCIKVINKDNGKVYITELPYYFIHPYFNFSDNEKYLPQYMTLLVMAAHSCYNIPINRTFGVDLIWLPKN